MMPWIRKITAALYLQVLISTMLSGQGASAAGLDPAPFKAAVRTGTISSPYILEASGIFASRQNRSVLWVVNDSGNPAVLYAISTGGSLIKKFDLKDLDGRSINNTDWEDLAGFDYLGDSFLVVADVGDNRAWRKSCSLLFVREPDLDQGVAEQDDTLAVQWQMRFQYADGPRDCESVAVDLPGQKILLLSKRTRPPVLYALPLVVRPTETLYTAMPVADLATIPPPTPEDLKEKYGKYSSRPTSMDLSGDGGRLVVLTYKDAYLFQRTPGQPWQEALALAPRLIRLPGTGELVQREAICFDRETGRLIVTSEKASAPIYTLEPEN